MVLFSSLLLSLRCLLAYLFFYSGREKTINPHAFRHDLSEYQLLPPRLLNPSATAIPIVELSLALFLFLGIVTQIAAAFSAMLLLVFSFAVAINILRGRKIDCGCTGTSKSETIQPRLLLRNFIYILVTFPLIVYQGGMFSLEQLFGNEVMLVVLLHILLLGIPFWISVLLFGRLRRLVALVP